MINPPKSSDSYFGFFRKDPIGSASAWAAAKNARASPTPFPATYFSGSLKQHVSVTMSPSNCVVTLPGRLLKSRIMPWFWAAV